jgi:HSP20 family protein
MNFLKKKHQEELHPLANFPKRFEDMWESFWNEPLGWPKMGMLSTSNFQPRIEVNETEEELRVVAELPGMTEKDIEVTLDDGTLCIKGEKRREEEKQIGECRYTERSYGSFYRTIPVSSTTITDKTKATFANGVLTLSLPKDKQLEQKKRIPIKTEQS